MKWEIERRRSSEDREESGELGWEIKGSIESWSKMGREEREEAGRNGECQGTFFVRWMYCKVRKEEEGNYQVCGRLGEACGGKKE